MLQSTERKEQCPALGPMFSGNMPTGKKFCSPARDSRSTACCSKGGCCLGVDLRLQWNLPDCVPEAHTVLEIAHRDCVRNCHLLFDEADDAGAEEGSRHASHTRKQSSGNSGSHIPVKSACGPQALSSGSRAKPLDGDGIKLGEIIQPLDVHPTRHFPAHASSSQHTRFININATCDGTSRALQPWTGRW